MKDGPVSLAWREAAMELGIEVVAPFEMAMEDGTTEPFAALVKHFGCPLGTVVESYLTGGDRFQKRSAIADAAGYYYSQLNPEIYGSYSRTTFIETLVDWGWAEPNVAAPGWYKEAVEKSVLCWRAKSYGGLVEKRSVLNPEAALPDSPWQRPVDPFGRRWFRFLAGLAWTAAVASIFSLRTRCPFLFAFAAVLGGFFVYGGLGLWWLTLWARQKDARPGQFGIGSLLFLMVFAALFFGTVRWIVDLGPQANDAEAFCICALACLVLAVISVPFVLFMSEAVICAAVWFIKRPHVGRWIRGRRRNERV
jgi:hypothetical protein